jgi:hypothetical protein
MQLAGHRGGLPAGVKPGPFQTPGADETPEEHELVAVPGRRTGDVERLYQPGASLGRIRFAGHWLCSLRGAERAWSNPDHRSAGSSGKDRSQQ